MNEAVIVGNIIQHLTVALGRRAVILKHNDRVTAGVPDISVTCGGRTTWLEVKLLRDWDEPLGALKKKFNALQLATMRLLAENGRALYVVAYRDHVGQKMLGLYPPQYVVNVLNGTNPGVAYWASFHDSLVELARRVQEGDRGKA